MNFKPTIRQNAVKIAELHSRIHETGKLRDERREQEQERADGCSEFHESYSRLAFIGGVETSRDRLRAGDTEAIDYVLDFLEIRPYFFRSGYMYNDFMRVLRNCPLSPGQRGRYDRIYERYLAYRDRRRQTGNAQ